MNFAAKHTVHALIGINILLFLLQMTGMHGLITHGALYTPLSPYYQHWQWFSHMFLHQDLLHLLMNMYGLAVFGTPLLQVWGVRRFLTLYFAAGLLGALLYGGWNTWLLMQAAAALPPDTALPPSFTALLLRHAVGASGAVFGILAAFSLRFPHTRLSLMFIPVDFPARYFVLALVAYELFAQISGISLFGAHIAHLAHIGGALAGWLLALWWRQRRSGSLHLVK
ncbi:MAG: rhomboid family intramembrane serine protease [Conchiformibius sp.]|nr:rhomboid family intramembrane serine protease [Conchiformibius sp.]